MEGTARCAQGVDALAHRRILHQWRGMLRLDPRIDHQRSLAAQVFLVDERADAPHVRRRVGTRERHPTEVVQRTGGKSLSSARMTSGNMLIASAGRYAEQKRARS